MVDTQRERGTRSLEPGKHRQFTSFPLAPHFVPAYRRRDKQPQGPSLPLGEAAAHPMAYGQPTKCERAYQPIPSVWQGEDRELLELMLDFYPRQRPQRILDATVNVGRFWVGSKREPIGIDINPRFRPTVVGDNLSMPFRNECFQVVVYDPPHIPNQGLDRQKDFNTRFGLVLKSSRENGYNFSHLFSPFLREAYRVLAPEGVAFCKITDYIHNHRLQWAHIDLVQEATAAGFVPCDCIVKIRKGPIVDPKWRTAHHARRHHSYWLVFRKSDRCE